MNSILQRIFPKEGWQYLAVNLILPVVIVLVGFRPTFIVQNYWIIYMMIAFVFCFHATAHILHRHWDWNEK